MPGKASQRISVQWGVETIVDPCVLLPYQHLNIHKHLTLHNDESFVFVYPFNSFFLIFTMTIRVMFVGPRASRVSGPSVGRL